MVDLHQINFILFENIKISSRNIELKTTDFVLWSDRKWQFRRSCGGRRELILYDDRCVSLYAIGRLFRSFISMKIYHVEMKYERSLRHNLWKITLRTALPLRKWNPIWCPIDAPRQISRVDKSGIQPRWLYWKYGLVFWIFLAKRKIGKIEKKKKNNNNKKK